MWRDEPLLLDMLQAAGHATDHVGGLSREEFLASKLHQDAVIRELEVLGEAAGRALGSRSAIRTWTATT